MDFVRPIEAVVPGAQGRILGVLARSAAPVNLRTLADLAGISSGQASRVLPRLVALGIVQRTDVPPAAMFALNRKNHAARLISSLATLSEQLMQEMKRRAARIAPAPVSAVLFGSLARGEARTESDIDVVFVRPSRIPDDDDRWTESIGKWVEDIQQISGNSVNILDVSEDEVTHLLRSRRSPWAAIAREGMVLSGRSLQQLGEPRVPGRRKAMNG